MVSILGTQLAPRAGLTIFPEGRVSTFTAYNEPNMSQLTTVGRLLNDLQSESAARLQSVVRAAGVSPENAEAAMRGVSRLTLSEQLRLSEAVLLLEPTLSREALRLREQVLAARSYETGDGRAEAPAQRWECVSGSR